MEKEFSVIGKGVPRVDAVLKATGQAKYGADYALPGMLFGKILRSPHPHAKTLNIDTSKASKLIGVQAIVTGKDFPGTKYGCMGHTRDQSPLANEKVRYIGDEVAAIAAVDEDTAEEALGLVDVDYEILPAVFDPDEAIKEGAPQIHDHVRNNISAEAHFEHGDIQKAFKESYLVREDVYNTQAIKHGFLEPHTSLCNIDANGKITLIGNKQSPYIVYRKLGMGLNLPLNKFRVIQTYIGGGFGSGRSDVFPLDFCAIVMAKKTNKPVRFVYTMRDVMVMGEMKHPFKMRVKTGVKKDGSITAIQAEFTLDGGAYSSIGPITVCLPGFFIDLPFKVPNFKYDGYRVFTNKGFCGSMRGHSIAQTRFAIGSQLDQIAHDLGMDPIEIHLKNAVEPGYISPNGAKVTSCGFRECIEKARDASKWKEKKGKLPPYRGIGIGATAFASGVKISGHSSCTAVIKMQEDGTAALMTGATDVGQGSNTVLAQIAAEVLGLEVEDIVINEGVDTDFTPIDPGTYSSRVTFYAGNAVKLASEDVRNQLARIAAGLLDSAKPEALVFKGREVFVKGLPEKRIPIDKLIRYCQNKLTRVIIGHASYDPDIPFIDITKGKGNPSAAYTFAADIIELEIDPETGKIELLNCVGAHDVGKALNPQQVEGQLNGAFVQAQGQLLYEDLIRRDGEVVNPNFMDYKMPTSMDITKKHKNILVETIDPMGPFGAKEVGEGSSVAIFPALSNAIYDAIGVRINDLPITPERILRAIKEKEEQERDERIR